MRRSLFTLPAILILAGPGPAAAADFTFDVPVRIENLPALTSIDVTCFVSRVPLGGSLRAAGSNVIGRNRIRVPVSGGSYSGEVTVEVEPSGVILSAEARSYSCSLAATGTARTGRTFSASPDGFAAGYESATGHTIERVTSNVEGSIP